MSGQHKWLKIWAVADSLRRIIKKNKFYASVASDPCIFIEQNKVVIFPFGKFHGPRIEGSWKFFLNDNKTILAVYYLSKGLQKSWKMWQNRPQKRLNDLEDLAYELVENYSKEELQHFNESLEDAIDGG